jgi:hypothetical protein
MVGESENTIRIEIENFLNEHLSDAAVAGYVREHQRRSIWGRLTSFLIGRVF